MRPRASPLETGQRDHGETAGDQLQAEEHDHHETHRKHERPDERHIGLDRRCDCEARGKAEQRPGQKAANQQVLDRKTGFGFTGGDHVFHNVDGFDVVHSISGALAATVPNRAFGRDEARA